MRSLTAKIKERAEQSSVPVRRTMPSEVISPANMQKRQIRNGLLPTTSTPDALTISKARREIFNTG
jgi:flagella basal body P-ring formation protein FlgA